MTIRVEADVIYLDVRDGREEIHLTFNPLQIATLNKYLFATLDFVTLADCENFGNWTMEVENEELRNMSIERVPKIRVPTFQLLWKFILVEVLAMGQYYLAVLGDIHG